MKNTRELRDKNNNERGRCKFVPKRTMGNKVQSFLKTTKWGDLNYGDDLLYQAVNASLDRTIDEVIGRATFDAAMAEFQKAKSLAREKCPTPILACSSNGTFIPRPERDKCYKEDAGCGYRCLDKIFR